MTSTPIERRALRLTDQSDILSWRFKSLGEWPFVMIISPVDERLLTNTEAAPQTVIEKMAVRVKAWSDKQWFRGDAEIGDQKIHLEQIGKSAVWQASVDIGRLPDGINPFAALLEDEAGKSARDTVRPLINPSSRHWKPASRSSRDSENAIGAWPERETQLGPNKNGRTW